MRGFIRIGLTLTPLALVCGLSWTAVAHAEPAKCRAAILQAAGKLTATRLGLLQRCEELIVKGKLPIGTNCLGDPRTAARTAKAERQLRRAIAQKCGGKNKTCSASDTGSNADDPLATIGWGIGACPDIDNAGCTAPIHDCHDIAECLTCINRAPVGRAVGLIYDSLVLPTAATNKQLNKCQQVIGRQAARFFAITAKALRGCWSHVNRGTKGFGSSCPLGDPTEGTFRKMKRAELRAISGICSACGGKDKVCGATGDLAPAHIGFPPTCPDLLVPGVAGRRCGGPVGSLEDLATCVDCVTQFQVACLDAASVPWGTIYPPQCNPSCGDGIREDAEECDGTDDDACPARCLPGCACQAAPAATPTPTPPAGSGATPTPPGGSAATPTPGSTSVPPCATAPRVSCRRPKIEETSLLLLNDAVDDAKDSLTWRWIRGASTTKADFGNPTADTSYAFCVYDEHAGIPMLRLALAAPAADVCDISQGRACWRPTHSGFRYRDKALTPNGMRTLNLKEGLDEKAAIVLTGKGANLHMPALASLVHPLVAQLVASNGLCWEARYTAPALKLSTTRFKDKGD